MISFMGLGAWGADRASYGRCCHRFRPLHWPSSPHQPLRGSFWDAIDREGDEVTDEDAVAFQEAVDSFGWREGEKPTADIEDHLDGADLEAEVEQLRQHGLEPLAWDVFLTEEEARYMREPNLPFDPINRRMNSTSRKEVPRFPVRMIPIDEVDLSSIVPLRWEDVDDKRTHLQRFADDLAASESLESIEYNAHVPTPSKEDIVEWRRAEQERGGRATKYESFELPPYDVAKYFDDNGGDQDAATSSSSPSELPLQWSTLCRQLSGLWLGSAHKFDAGTGAVLEGPFQRQSSYNTEVHAWESLSLDPSLLWLLKQPRGEVVIVSDTAAEGKAQWASLEQEMQREACLPRGTVIFEDGSFVAGSPKRRQDQRFFCDFCFHDGDVCYRIHAFAPLGTAIETVVVSIEHRAKADAGHPDTQIDPTERVTIDDLLGLWQGEATSIVTSFVRQPATTVASGGEVLQEALDLEEVVDTIDRISTTGHRPPSPPKRPAKRPSKKVKEARARDRSRLEQCNFVESSWLGSYTTSLPGTIVESHAIVDFPRLENGVPQRRTVLLPCGLTLHFPTSLQLKSRWLITATYHPQPVGKERHRLRLIRAYNPQGDFVGAAHSHERIQTE